MRRLLNIILLTILIYILYLAYKGDGVVDFNLLLTDIRTIYTATAKKIKSFIR